MIPFERPLREGVIIKRKGQFTMTVGIDGTETGAHCPTTGRIGDIELHGRPCLLSESGNPLRKTRFTVEAVSLDEPGKEGKEWIGINQNAVNRYIEHYLRNGQLSDILGTSREIEREKTLGDSKLDFLAGDTYIEVKMPLQSLQVHIPDHVKTRKTAPFGSTDRFVRHMTELGNSLEDHQRAILLNCFMYDNPGFRVTQKSTNYEMVTEAVRKSTEKGVEMWQVDLRITPEGVEMTKVFRITFDEILSGR